MMAIYEIPDSISNLFLQGENSYRIIDYDINDMDNIESMDYFLDCLEVEACHIVADEGTQVILEHPNFNFQLVIDSGGLGDFFSHGFDVSILKEE